MTPDMPAWAWCFLFLALASLIAGSLEQSLFDRMVAAITRRQRRAAVWRALARRQRALDATPDQSTARGVDVAAFQLAPRS